MITKFRQNIAQSSAQLMRFALVAAALVVVTIPAIAISGAWKWTDQSALLPHRDGLSISMASARQNDWLVSDGSHLYRFDGVMLQDLTQEARNRGLQGISDLSSDGRNWLVHYQPLDRADSKLWLTDGQTWTDLSGKFLNSEGGIDAAGNDGVWYIRTYQKATSIQPSTWELSSLNGSASTPNHVSLPASIANVQAGCFSYSNSSTLCSSVSAPVFVNGNWYFIGGTSQSRGTNGIVTQSAKAGIWKLNPNSVSLLPSLPNFSFVSDIWPGKSGVLIATTNSVTNPYASDHFWMFDGTSLRDVSNIVSPAGLLNVDAREIHASWSGRSWMILIGKQLFRFDGTAVSDEGKTRDLFQTIASDGNGQLVLGGVVSNMTTAFATSPLTAKLVSVIEDLSAPVVSIPLVTGSVSEVLSKVNGPSVTVTSDPANALIGNGKTFTLHASAQDQSGVDHVDMYVMGARVKSCAGNVCDYQQQYWTNATASRRVEMFARATNKNGYANDSAVVTLTVDNSSQATASGIINNQQPTTNIESVPAGKIWTQDVGSGIRWTSWTDPNQTLLTSGGKMTYAVAANDADGLTAMEIWVNGSVKRTCQLSGSKATNICTFDLLGTDYPYGTEVFVNANVIDAKNNNAWTAGTRVQRDTAAVLASAPLQPTTYNLQPTLTGPVFTTVVTVDPNTSNVTRGTTLQVRSTSLNNTLGLARVDLFMNGTVNHACTFGAAVSAVACDATIDTSAYNDGTSLSFVARATDNNGHEIWSNTKGIIVRTATVSQTSTSAPNGMSVWAWQTPSVTELSDDQTATYSVGAWSPNGLNKIEMIVDGTVRQVCYGSTGSKECSYTLSANAFTHGHIVSLGARVTDSAGMKLWAEPRFVTIKRSWTPLNNPGAYTTITTDHSLGYVSGEKITLTARGWSPNGVDHIEIYSNGVKVVSCPSDICTWITPSYMQTSLEYQAHAIDRLGQDTWSALAGIIKK